MSVATVRYKGWNQISDFRFVYFLALDVTMYITIHCKNIEKDKTISVNGGKKVGWVCHAQF